MKSLKIFVLAAALFVPFAAAAQNQQSQSKAQMNAQKLGTVLYLIDNFYVDTANIDKVAEDAIIAALKELPSHPAPYVVHCMEGKDRTGYVCALLEGLCGATYEEMVADYLITYNNYYQITPEENEDICNALVSLRLNPCLMYYAGIDDEAQLPNVDYAEAFSNYLLSHGMSSQQISELIQALTVD